MKPFLPAATAVLAASLVALSGCSNERDEGQPDAATDSAADTAITAEPATPKESAANREALTEAVTDTLKPGLWALDFTIAAIEAPDAPEVLRKPLQALKGSTQSYRHCLPADQAGRPDPEFFGNDGAQDCSYDSFSQSGDFATISMTCGAANGRRARTDMQGTLGETSFDLSMANEVLGSANGKIKLAGKLTGKRVGDCEG